MNNDYTLHIDYIPQNDSITVANNKADEAVLPYNPFEDIKYTLCGYGQQLEYLNYEEVNVSTSITAKECK